mmetsp:Transcript_2448/g.7247  ORF Transcript_2448/g.7247 Transcript_2448/m.7247 type:complete len:218 (+) Transcript_2448:123-776(+)
MRTSSRPQSRLLDGRAARRAGRATCASAFPCRRWPWASSSAPAAETSRSSRPPTASHGSAPTSPRRWSSSLGRPRRWRAFGGGWTRRRVWPQTAAPTSRTRPSPSWTLAKTQCSPLTASTRPRRRPSSSPLWTPTARTFRSAKRAWRLFPLRGAGRKTKQVNRGTSSWASTLPPRRASSRTPCCGTATTSPRRRRTSAQSSRLNSGRRIFRAWKKLF